MHFSFPLQTTCPSPLANEPRASRLLITTVVVFAADALADATAPLARPLIVEGATSSSAADEDAGAEDEAAATDDVGAT